MKIGFSGSANGLKSPQLDIMLEYLVKNYQHDSQFHHGDCVGADTQAHIAAIKLGYQVHIHPPLNEKQRAFNKGDFVRNRHPYKVRNKFIVQATDMLLACPTKPKGQGGTWNTISWAMLYFKPTTIIHPNGLVERFNFAP